MADFVYLTIPWPRRFWITFYCMVFQLSPPPRVSRGDAKYMVRSASGEVVYRTDSPGAAMQALARFILTNPHLTAAVYRRTGMGWVIYSLFACGLVGV